MSSFGTLRVDYIKKQLSDIFGILLFLKFFTYSVFADNGILYIFVCVIMFIYIFIGFFRFLNFVLAFFVLMVNNVSKSNSTFHHLRLYCSIAMKTSNCRNYPPPLRGPPPYFIKDKTGMKSFSHKQLFHSTANFSDIYPMLSFEE